MEALEYLGSPSGIFNNLPWYEASVRDAGHDCPTCGRLLKVYHRKLSSSMTRSLMRLYRLTLAKPTSLFFHVKQFDREKARGEFGVLSSWGLVEEQPNTNVERKSSGMWAITTFGQRFVTLQEMVPQYVILKWGSEVLGFSGPMVGARECLEKGNRFRYDELMSSPVTDFFS